MKLMDWHDLVVCREIIQLKCTSLCHSGNT